MKTITVERPTKLPMHPKTATQRYRAPREDGEVYRSMSPSEVVLATESNRDSLGSQLGQIRTTAREEFLQAAIQYSSKLDHAKPSHSKLALDKLSKNALIVTGHQPELVHPGVWFKYANASAIANASDGIAINIIVDNDTIRSRTVSLPEIKENQFKKRRLHFDDGPARIPWEDTIVENEDRLESFPKDVQEILKLRDDDIPLLDSAWTDVIASTKRGMNLSDAFTTARRRIDRELGLQIYDIPLSQVCQLPTFINMAVKVFADLPRFREIYNQAIRDYRQANGIKSDTHPMTELEQDGEWIESPFWIWKKGEPTRRRLFARCLGSTLELSDRRENSVDLPCPRALPDASAQALLEVMQSSLRIRPRALITTMVARLLYSDLFIHGIGGAKYDEMTDQIIAEYFDVTPPKFLVATATLHLPIEELDLIEKREDPGGLAKMREQLRRMHFNPEEFLTSHQMQDQKVSDLREAKSQIIAKQKASSTSGLTRRERQARRSLNRGRYQQIENVNAELREVISEQIRETELALQKAQQAQRDAQITHSREYPYVLFPKSALLRLIPAE